VAELLEMTPADVAGIASFYYMFHKRSVGKYLIEVCVNYPCMLRGAEEVLEYLQQKLGISVGETTPDGRFTLREEECPCSCEFAPVMQINSETYGPLTTERIDRILQELP